MSHRSDHPSVRERHLTTELMYLLLDELLEPAERIAAEAHLVRCPRCLAEIQATRCRIAALRRSGAALHVRAVTRAHILAHLRAEAQPQRRETGRTDARQPGSSTPSIAAAPAQADQQFGQWRKLLAGALPLAAVVALIVATVLVFGSHHAPTAGPPRPSLPRQSVAGKLAPQLVGTVNSWREYRVPAPIAGLLFASADAPDLYFCTLAPAHGAVTTGAASVGQSSGGTLIGSHDNGATWQPLSLPVGLSPCQGDTLSMDPTNPQHLVLAGSAGQGSNSPWLIATSRDGGSSWHTVQSSLAVSPQVAGKVLYGQVIAPGSHTPPANALVRSTDGGATWQALDQSLRTQGLMIADFAVDPRTGALDALVAPNVAGEPRYTFWQLTAGSRTWQALGSLPVAIDPASAGQPLLIPTQAPHLLYLHGPRPTGATTQPQTGSTWDGFARSTDGGRTWALLPPPPVPASAQPPEQEWPVVAPDGDLYLGIPTGSAEVVEEYPVAGTGWQVLATVSLPAARAMPGDRVYLSGQTLWAVAYRPQDAYLFARPLR